MDDAAKLKTAKTLLLLLSSKEAFIGTCRWRAKEWSALVWVFYSWIERDNYLAASMLIAPYRKPRSLSNRQRSWLERYDQWKETLPS